MRRRDEPIEGISLLSVPPPGPEFWTQLHDQLMLDTAADEDDLIDAEWGGAPPGRRRSWLVAAAVLAVVVGGLVAIELIRGDRRSEVPAEQPVVITDPLAIDLDPWATQPPLRAPGPFAVFDLEHLPVGWSVRERPLGAHEVGDPDPEHYRWRAGLSINDGRIVWVSVVRHDEGEVATLGPDVVVTVQGQSGNVNGDTIEWTDADGVRFTVSSAGASPDELVEMANALPIERVAELNAPALNVVAGRVHGTTRLAGVIDGVEWSVASGDDARSELSFEAGGKPGASSSSAQPSPPADDRWDVAVTGLGPHGTVVFGIAPVAVDRIEVVVDRQTSVELPVARDAQRAAVYAVPIPAGLTVSELRFLDATGAVLHRADGVNALLPALGSSVALDAAFGSVAEPVAVISSTE